MTSLLSRLQEQKPYPIIFDIETGPKPDSELAKYFRRDKVKLPKHPGQFDPTGIRYGNIVDPTKRQAKRVRAEQDHRVKIAEHAARVGEAMDEAFNEFKAEAALKSHLCVVLAVGYGLWDGDNLLVATDIDSNETDLVERFWDIVKQRRQYRAAHGGAIVVGWNSNSFDMRIMIQKAYTLNLSGVPRVLQQGRYLEEMFVDAKTNWSSGNLYAERFTRLDDVARAMGVRMKMDGVTGDQFYRVLATNPSSAKQYLHDDIVCTFDVAQRVGVFDGLAGVLRQETTQEQDEV